VTGCGRSDPVVELLPCTLPHEVQQSLGEAVRLLNGGVCVAETADIGLLQLAAMLRTLHQRTRHPPCRPVGGEGADESGRSTLRQPVLASPSRCAGDLPPTDARAANRAACVLADAKPWARLSRQRRKALWQPSAPRWSRSGFHGSRTAPRRFGWR